MTEQGHHKNHQGEQKILFLLKLRYNYGSDYGPHCEFPDRFVLESSGLFNSATFVKNMLVNEGYNAKLVQVVDANGIDKQVHEYKPTIVILEALWVTPTKLKELKTLHPNVKWIVRLHSEVPFLATEGIAMSWINEYFNLNNVFIAFNSENTYIDFIKYFTTIVSKHIAEEKILYLPNYYPTPKHHGRHHFDRNNDTINIGCFGAPRPMKNQLIQAFAAAEFARKHNFNLKFHINTGRIDSEESNTIIKNLRNFFKSLPSDKFELIEHEWLSHHKFMELIKTLDVGMQLSLSETFNIVAADFVSIETPIVVSHEISWISNWFKADPTDVENIVKALRRVLYYDFWGIRLKLAKQELAKYSGISEEIWELNLADLDCPLDK